MLLLIACFQFSTARCQSDSLVAVQYSRLVKWASLRSVGDSTIREIAHDFARQQQQLIQASIIIDRDSVILDRQADEIQGWKDAEAVVQQALKDERKKGRAAKVWRFIEGALIGAAAALILTR